MEKLVGKCSHFMEIVYEKLCFRQGGKKEKKKPTINVTQALQMNQVQDDVKEKQLPATKPSEILKRGIEDLLKQLKSQENHIDFYIKTLERQIHDNSEDYNRYQEFLGQINYLINTTEENEIEDEEDKEKLQEFKKGVFYQNLQQFLQERKKQRKKKHHILIQKCIR